MRGRGERVAASREDGRVLRLRRRLLLGVGRRVVRFLITFRGLRRHLNFPGRRLLFVMYVI